MVARKIGIFLLLACLFFACSVSKKIQKDNKETEQSEKTDTTGSVKSESNSALKSKTEITEIADTTITVKGFIHSEKSTDLITKPIVISDNGFTAIVMDSAGTTLLKVKLEDKQVPVNVNKKTVINTEIKKEEKADTKVSSSKESEKKEEEQVIAKDIKRSGFPWWLWLILILVTLGYLGYKYHLVILKLLK